MRAYVITREPIGDPAAQEIIGVVSSKRHAIDACEGGLDAETIGRTGDNSVVRWVEREKHTGYATDGAYTTTYKMFFINK